jgi:hypothetical protein
MARHIKFACVLLGVGMGIWCTAAWALPHGGFPDPTLPPVNPDPNIGYYGHDLHAMYPQGVILNDPFHHAFTGIYRIASGPDEIETFNSVVDALVDVPSMGMFGVPVTLTGPVTTAVRNYTSGQLGTFNVEMLSMSLSGNLLGTPVMVRESPMLHTLGQTSISGGQGNYTIDSFFDVFTELSLDGGMTWGPDTNGPGHMELCPEPATLALLTLGGLAMLRRRG